MLHEEDSSIRENERLAEEQRLINIEARLSADKRDAERYRWLRAQHWSESRLCVVEHPKNAVKLGHVCPSLDRLDAAIDEAIKATNKQLNDY